MKEYRGNTLLVELVIVLFFFALSLGIALQAFFRAQTLNRDAQVLNLALLRATDAAETLTQSDDAAGTLSALGFSQTDQAFSAEGDGYRLTAELTETAQLEGTLTTVQITGWQGERSIFTLPAARYREGGAP